MESVTGVGLMGWRVDLDGTWHVYLYIDGELHHIYGAHELIDWTERIPEHMNYPAELLIIT